MAAWRSFLMAIFCVYGLYGANEYPAFGRAKEYDWDWIWPILLRNLLGTWYVCM
jgi:hypothetical protein